MEQYIEKCGISHNSTHEHASIFATLPWMRSIPMAIGTVHPFSPRFRPVAAHRTVERFSKETSFMEAKSPPTAEARLPRTSNTPEPPVLCGAGSETSTAYFVAGGKKQTLDTALRAFGKAPASLILAIFAFLLMNFILRNTKIGTYCCAIGSNEYITKNMGINVDKYKLIGFVLTHFFVGIMAVLTVSYGWSMTAITGMESMGRNFTPLMGTFLGLAFRKYGIPVLAIIIGEFIISIIFNGFIAIGAPTTIQNVVTGAALLIIVTLIARPEKGAVVK